MAGGKGQVESGRSYLRSTSVDFLPPESSCLPPKRSVNPGGPVSLTAGGRGQVEGGKIRNRSVRSTFHLLPNPAQSALGRWG